MIIIWVSTRYLVTQLAAYSATTHCSYAMISNRENCIETEMDNCMIIPANVDYSNSLFERQEKSQLRLGKMRRLS